MINNPLSNHLNRFFNRGANTNGAAGASGDATGKTKNKNDKSTQQADATGQAENAAATGSETAARQNARKNYADAYEGRKSGSESGASGSQASGEDTVELTPMEQRQKRLDEILAKVEEDYAAKYPHLAKKDKEAEAARQATETSEILTSDDAAAIQGVKDKDGVSGFINDMPLFNEFKTGLMDAFKRLDSSTSGSISAQYELNYSSMQYIADEAGGYEYKETSLNIKLDLNYIKAAGGGGKTGAEIASAIENAEDFESFCAVLQDIAKQQQGGTTSTEASEAAAIDTTADGKSSNDAWSQYMSDNGKPMSAKQIMNNMFKNVTPDGVMQGMEDYFGSEATAGRILDFATAFFEASDEYKEGGDTEEARQAFSDRMGKAIQKGFDQALGKIGGNYTGTVKDGVDKTHELVFKGLEDFVKNGKEKTEEAQEKSKALEEFAFSFEMSYSQKTSSVSYGSSRAQESSSLNTQA